MNKDLVSIIMLSHNQAQYVELKRQECHGADV